MPGVLFGYGLDLSRCIGCRRCEYACVKENNQSRDPQLHWIRVLEMEKEKGIDLERANPYYDPATGARRRPLLRAGGLSAVHQLALHARLPGGRHLARARRHRGHRLRLVHRLPQLHGGLPVRRPALQLGRRHHPRRRAQHQHARLRQPPAAARAWSRSAPGACSAPARGATRPASRSARWARASSATCNDPESEISRILKQKRVFVLKSELRTEPKFFYFYGL